MATGSGYKRPTRLLPDPCVDCGGPVVAHRSDIVRCAECRKARRRQQDRESQRRTRKTNGHKERYRAWSLMTRYGLTPEDVERMLLEQDGCAICHSPTPNWVKDWHIDHNHKTGETRGVLCHNCNLLIGHAGDSPEILRNAIIYLGA